MSVSVRLLAEAADKSYPTNTDENYPDGYGSQPGLGEGFSARAGNDSASINVSVDDGSSSVALEVDDVASGTWSTDGVNTEISVEISDNGFQLKKGGNGVEEVGFFPHPEYASLGNAPDERACAYRELFRGHLSKDDLHNIRKAMYYSQPLGDERFTELISERYGVEIGVKRRGRPARTCAG